MVTDHQLVIDVQTIQSPQFSERGIPRYTAELSLALLRAGAPVAALALNPALPFPRRLHPELARAPQLCWNTAAMFHRLADAGPVAYHVMSPFEGPRPVQTTLPPYALGNDVRLVCTLYDLIPEIFEVYAPGSQFHRLYQQRLEMLKRADLLITISDNTSRDAVRLLGVDPEKIAMVGAGASTFFHLPGPSDDPRALLTKGVRKLKRPFVLAVTGVFGLDKRKNTEVLIDAFGQLPEAVRTSHQLVVTCKLTDEDADRWHARARQQGLDHDTLVLTGYVPDVVLRALYQQARLFVYPSLYEGFGLPALEAARCGCATITSNTSSLPEVLGWEPATFDPTDADNLAAVITKSLADEGFRTRLLEAAEGASERHTWERVAEKTIAAYRTLDAPRRHRRPRRLRLALIGPFPPGESGVGHYDQAVAEALSERCEVDCFGEHDDEQRKNDDGNVVPRPHTSAYRRFPVKALGSVLSPSSYDALIYVLGNSTQHHHRTYEMFLRFPGIAWFHDVSLAAMYLGYARRHLPPPEAHAFMLNTIRHHYWERAGEDLVDEDNWETPAVYEAAGIRLTGAIGSRSRANIVGSELARSLMELDSGPFTEPSPTFVVPPAVRSCAAGYEDLVRDRRGAAGLRGGAGSPLTPSENPLVVALGSVSTQTRPEALVEAVARLGPDQTADLAFVGPADQKLARSVLSQARTLGLTGRVTITGFLDPPDYWEWARRATCVVQLRSDAGGGGGLPLADALGAGRAVVTSATAALDLPPGTVRLVPAAATPADLAAEIGPLVAEDKRRVELEDGARGYAESATFDGVAGRLIEIAELLNGRRGDPHP
ncbi:MAG: hypothetical protein QOG82_735 [Actinomycetota bacterium]|nr:hypothetical protein [Actinomycetota bacterium]